MASRILFSAARSGATVAGRSVPRMTQASIRSMGGNMEVKRSADLERWNNIRDNIDQTYDITDPKTLALTIFWAAVVPILIYRLIESEGLAPNGDESTGRKFGPKSDTSENSKPQTS